MSNAAEAIFGKGSEEGDAWYEAKRAQLLEEEDGANKVYRSLLYFQKTYSYTKDRKESLCREATLFRNNKDRMEYKRFRDNGWSIGNGVVKSRFCRSGMRWTRSGGQTILTLRALLKSGRWDSFWQFYKTTRFAHTTNFAA